MRYYLSYWTPQNAHHDHDGGADFSCAWNSRYDKVKSGDMICMVTAENNRLILLGCGTVAESLSQSEAMKHPFFKGKSAWPMGGSWEKYWVIFEDPKPLSWIDITDLTPEIRFESKSNPGMYKEPAKWGNALQTLRTLTPESAHLLQTRLGGVAAGGALAAPSDDIETPEESNARTVTNYTSYWKPLTAQANEGTLMGGSSSAQYKRVLEGDVLWILMVKDAHLFLVGMGVIEEVMTDEQAVKRFGDNWWEAEYHVAFKKPYVPYELRDITDMSKDLRFEGPNSSLPDDPGKWANALRTLRKLTLGSVNMLATRLQISTSMSDSFPLGEFKLGNAPVGAGFGDPISNREVEKAAIDFVTTHYSALGWKVTSKEREKCGYDFLCEKGDQVHHVEVKGVKGAAESVILTRNEVAYLDQPFSFMCIVSTALSSPKLTSYSGEEFKRQFKLQAYSFIATKVQE